MGLRSFLKRLVRRGYTQEPVASIPCPHCGLEIRYYHYSGMGEAAPHFYCNTCSNLYFNPRHRDLLYGREPSMELLKLIEQELPSCPCGGRFVPGSNPKCPHCGREVEHDSDPVERLSDPYAIQVEGARFISDD